MKGFILSKRVLADLFDIWSYIARDSEEAADRVQAELYRAFQSLAGMPGQGHTRTDLTTKPVRFFPVYSYLIVYRSEANKDLEIVGVLSGYRDVKRILRQRLD